jgi:20S proteasome alpha/beta subunit
MTCIVGIVAKDGVYMGCDSLASEPDSLNKYPIKGVFKVFHNGPFLMGACGSFRMCQILQHSFKPPKKPKSMEDMEFMTTKFVNEIRRCFLKRGFGTIMKGESNLGGNFLVGYNGRLYDVRDDFQINEWEWGYATAGSGSSFALGSLFMTESNEPEERIIYALETAAHFNAGVAPPFHILYQKKKK